MIGDMLTISELIAELAKRGHQVAVYDLQNWQRYGLIPRGVRRRHNGATRKLYQLSDIHEIEEYLRRRSLPKRELLHWISQLEKQLADVNSVPAGGA